MILSVHIADLGWRAAGILRRRPVVDEVPGLRYAETVLTAALGGSRLPRPQPGRVGLIAGWESDEALDLFLVRHTLARQLADGWHVRLEPLRISGFWPPLPDLSANGRPAEEDEPVAVLTLGRLRLRRARPFLHSAAPAEGEAVADPALLAATGLARPPHLVSTFSLWRSAAAMREYAYDRHGAHQAAVRSDRAQPFHHSSAFIRFRPYASQGVWNGRDPLVPGRALG